MQSSTVRTQLQTELQQLRQELQRREGLATNTLAEKAALEGRVQSCQEELEAVKEELRMATEQRDHLETVRKKFNFYMYVYVPYVCDLSALIAILFAIIMKAPQVLMPRWRCQSYIT